MHLRSESTRLELEIESYQFPEISGDKYDSNWLVVKGVVEHAGKEWTFHDPCLLTWEAEEIAEWLEALSSGRSTTIHLSFIEPNISFCWQPSSSTLCVTLGLEALPPSRRSLVEEELSLPFSVSPASLHQVARELRAQLVRFPQRNPPSA